MFSPLRLPRILMEKSNQAGGSEEDTNLRNQHRHIILSVTKEPAFGVENIVIGLVKLVMILYLIVWQELSAGSSSRECCIFTVLHLALYLTSYLTLPHPKATLQHLHILSTTACFWSMLSSGSCKSLTSSRKASRRDDAEEDVENEDPVAVEYNGGEVIDDDDEEGKCLSAYVLNWLIESVKRPVVKAEGCPSSLPSSLALATCKVGLSTNSLSTLLITQNILALFFLPPNLFVVEGCINRLTKSPKTYTIANAGDSPTNAKVSSCDFINRSIPASAWSKSTLAFCTCMKRVLSNVPPIALFSGLLMSCSYNFNTGVRSPRRIRVERASSWAGV